MQPGLLDRWMMANKALPGFGEKKYQIFQLFLKVQNYIYLCTTNQTNKTMNTLKNHIILYDAECPMCKVYTKAFALTGMLDANGRAPYQDMPAIACPIVDQQRAVNEIALVNKTTGEVKYGIESLFTIIGHSFPIFKPLFSFKPFIWLMRKLYAFISYNRKVIIPAAQNTATIQPTFRLDYRIAYLLFTAALISRLLTPRELQIGLGAILFQGIFILLYAPAKKWDYLGNMMTIALAGAILLTTGYPQVVITLMLLENIRRMKLLLR